MSDWKTAQAMITLTQQSIKEREELVNLNIPAYMEQIMGVITKAASECGYEVRFELRPRFDESFKLFDQIVIVLHKKLESLGYQVSNNGIRFGFKISWAPRLFRR